jgi:hypothetical protein
MVPLHLSGNMSERQIAELMERLGLAISQAHAIVADQFDRYRADAILDKDCNIVDSVRDAVVEILCRQTVSTKYQTEEIPSDLDYPPAYRVRPLESQVTELRKCFPQLGQCLEKLSRRPLPDGAEGWFAIPRWQAVAPTYNEALCMALEVLGSRRKFANRLASRLDASYLRQSDRTVLGEKILADQQAGNDILVVGAQFGKLHRGCSARRTRVRLTGNEFPLSSFAICSMLLAHPERMLECEALMIDCSGDEYSLTPNGAWDRVPLFDKEFSGIEFSIFYSDRANRIWGTPTGFLYKMV